MEIGTICEKTQGRDKGRCVVIDLKENRILVTGPKPVTGVRRREVNPSHLRPTSETLKIKKGASDEEVAAALNITIKPARPRKEPPKPEKKAEPKKPEKKKPKPPKKPKKAAKKAK